LFLIFYGIVAFGQPPSVRIVLATPSDITAPTGVRHRLTQVADSAENFFFKEMNRWGYAPAVPHLFRREPDGLVEVLNVKGDKTVNSGRYANDDCVGDIIEAASRRYHVTEDFLVWWIFIYLGDRPVRFADWHGSGNPVDGGWAVVNYDTIPGEIRPDLGLAEGFNLEYFLKGTIHELGHAFGLPHVGPDPSLGKGNSLMGPVYSACVEREFPHCDQTYLSESSAAMLWKHPIFSGVIHRSVKLVDYKALHDRTDDSVTISGKLIADHRADSVILIDNRGRPDDEYWFQSYSARIATDGTFRIKIRQPAKADGTYRILFCFDNGIVTGDGIHFGFDNRGAIRKSYSYRDGEFRFSD
jgi:hypothetical protein